MLNLAAKHYFAKKKKKIEYAVSSPEHSNDLRSLGLALSQVQKMLKLMLFAALLSGMS